MGKKQSTEDLVGRQFGFWTLLEFVGNAPHARWLCQCQCGTQRVQFLNSLKRGQSKSCGCNRLRGSKHPGYKHGHAVNGRRSKTAAIYGAMLGRCNNPENKQYPDYGGRGITVCQRWRNSFLAFLEDMGEKPEGLQLDRIDNHGNYEPGNCRWVTARQQSLNRRSNRLLTFKGKTKCLGEWSEIMGIHPETLSGRLRRGWSIERALTQPVMRRRSR